MSKRPLHVYMEKTFAVVPACPERNLTYSRVGRPDGESSLLRMRSLHLSTSRLEGTGSPKP